MEYLERRVALVEDRIETVIDDVEPAALSDELGHVVLAGGKRVRPAVTILACEAFDGDPADAVDFAAGIEFVHNASLVIDDIIDRSAVRRGTASAWAEFGYGPAIVTSDGLLGEAFALFSTDERAMRTVAEAMVELG
ncbi:polyprenyl synthetase family protein, partial [Halorubrum tibetense]